MFEELKAAEEGLDHNQGLTLGTVYEGAQNYNLEPWYPAHRKQQVPELFNTVTCEEGTLRLKSRFRALP